MEIFRFKTSDKGKCFDVKLLAIEKDLTKQYEIIRPIKNTKRILFHALVNGQIEIVDLSYLEFRKMMDLMVDFGRRYEKRLTDGCYVRFDVDTVYVSDMELLKYDLSLVPSDLYNSESKEVKNQIEEFNFSLEKGLDSVKNYYSKDSHWSNIIKIS
jgi:hypothetical protein